MTKLNERLDSNLASEETVLKIMVKLATLQVNKLQVTTVRSTNESWYGTKLFFPVLKSFIAQIIVYKSLMYHKKVS